MSERGFNWGPSIFLITYQILLLITLPFYFYYNTPSLGIAIVSVVLLYLTGIAITGGYHRYFAHRTYKTNPFVEAILVFFGTMSCQGSVLRWSYDHRLHHAHVDTDNDPYSINKGFWYAHCLWILEKPRAIEPKIVSDLLKNKLLVFQHKYYPYLMVLTNAIAFVAVGFIFQDWWGAFFLALWLRLFALHHFTWFINSLAHTWGDKPFSQEQSAVNNYVISLLTFGEGYHNYHHTFANDYRNGIRWYHFDPTKWVIWALSKLGLAHSLKSMDAVTIKKRMVIEHKNLLLEQLAKFWSDKQIELEKQVLEVSERILQEIAEFNQLKEMYREYKSNNAGKDALNQIHVRIKELKKSLREDWKNWSELSHSIMNQKPLTA